MGGAVQRACGLGASGTSIRGDDIKRGSRLFVRRKQSSEQQALRLSGVATSGTFNPRTPPTGRPNWKLLRPITALKEIRR